MTCLTRSDLHDYQLKTVQFAIDNPKCALWLFLGAGKTASTLTACRDLLDTLEVNKVLIVAPLRVANTVWHTEIDKWEHLRGTTYSICTGSQKDRLSALDKDAELYIINRENIPWVVEHYKTKWPFDMFVLDESSSFKSHKSKRWKALRKVSKYIDRLVELTGTPSPQGLTDLWAQLFLLDGGQRLGKTYTAFIDRFFDSDYMGYSVTPKASAEAEIYKLVDEITFSVDVAKHSERIDITRYATLSDTHRKLYEKLEKEFLLEIEGSDITAMNAAALCNKLLQFANGNVYDENGETVKLHTAKIDVLKELVDEAQGEPLLVAYNFKSDLVNILEAFPHAEVLGKDMQQVNRWNRGEIQMLLAHPQGAAHGLNLQKGSSILVWYGLTWSLELYQQFVGRLDRQGQEKIVRNFHIVTEGTQDEGVMLAIANKAVTQDRLIDYMKSRYSIKNSN